VAGWVISNGLSGEELAVSRVVHGRNDDFPFQSALLKRISGEKYARHSVAFSAFILQLLG
jgi:hypothetical protein